MPDRPYTLLSCAVSIDGYLDDASPDRLILSGPEDLDEVDALRAAADAILVGAGTVRADNPRLLVRDPARIAAREAAGKPPHPLRVTMTATGDLDPAARFFTGPGTPLVYVASSAAAAAAAKFKGQAVGHRRGRGPLPGRRAPRPSSRTVRGDCPHRRRRPDPARRPGRRPGDELRLAIAPFFVADPAAPRFALPAPLPPHRRQPDDPDSPSAG